MGERHDTSSPSVLFEHGRAGSKDEANKQTDAIADSTLLR